MLHSAEGGWRLSHGRTSEVSDSRYRPRREPPQAVNAPQLIMRLSLAAGGTIDEKRRLARGAHCAAAIGPTYVAMCCVHADAM
jgi:hypothetical protein